VNSLREGSAWAYKIPDSPIFAGMKTRFTGAKPCDIVGGYAGYFFGIESKQIKKYQAFGIGALRPSQVGELSKITDAGNRAFVFLNVRIKKPYVNRLLIFDWEDDTWKGTPQRASLKKFDIEEIAMQEGIVGKNGLYDLGPFLEDLECATS